MVGSLFKPDVYIYNLKTLALISKIDVHTKPKVEAIFLKNNRAITKDENELYCWDLKDIKNPKKLFRTRNPGTIVRGPNRYF